MKFHPSVRPFHGLRLATFTLFISILFPFVSLAQTFFGVSANPTDPGNTTAASLTITPPASMLSGDLVVVYVHFKDNTGTLSVQTAGGQTWTSEGAQNSGDQRIRIFWCRYNGTWSVNPVFTSSAGGSESLTAVMYVFRPSNASNSWSVHIGPNTNTSTNTAVNINGVTTTLPNTVTMAFWGSEDDNTWGTFTGGGTGWSKTGLSTQYRNTGGSDQSHTSAYNIRTAAGATGNVSQTQATNGADDTKTTIISWNEVAPPTPPANNLCAGALPLTPGSSCAPTNGTLSGATYTTLTNTCGFANNDVWYSFTAGGGNQDITLGGTLGTAGRFQIFTAATCGGPESQVYCSTSNSALVTGLTPGQSYLLRVFSNNGSSASFNICIENQTPATLDYGKSYANITNYSGGGTISPGDILEIRATLVVRTLAVDSLSFIDTLGKGLNYIPGSLAIRTNEGKIYRWDNTNAATPPVAFTDNFDSDGGYVYTSGTDSIIRLNIGVGSTGSVRGKLRQNSAPRIGSGSTANSIIMATYRVVVDTSFSSIINLGGGYFTARDSASGVIRNLSFTPRSAIVYQTPGLCPNALSASNAISDESGGTFGNAILSGTGRPMKNRGTSTNVPSYVYAPFAASAPNDYFYGVSNNTGVGGANYTAINTWPKSSNRRVHNVWDITGDHTGAANTAAGNPPCDTTLAASGSNPCGYMLVVNSAYKTDTAFQYNISNLCPNTYYEISFWVKNICAKCGADSLGRWASTASYLPTATGDSSGVRPNLAIDINGIDYYTTGQISYVGTGVAQNLQDNTNIWVKRGFTYLTGTTPGTLVMSIRNTAPGGGGNDWALDDIAVATCYPSMFYSPSSTPSVCAGNVLEISDTVRSFFDNYTLFKWQKRANGVGSWADIAGTSGSVTPQVINSSYQFVRTYTIPPTQTLAANVGDQYRLVIASTPFNLDNVDCAYSDPTVISVDILTDCGPVLSTDLLSVDGILNNGFAKINWVTSREEEPVHFEMERSNDGISFSRINTIQGLNNGQVTNYYSFVDPQQVEGKKWYRLVMISDKGTKKYSRVVLLNVNGSDFEIENLINPFTDQLRFNLITTKSSKVTIDLISLQGKVVKSRSYIVNAGSNNLRLPDTDVLAAGIYTLRIQKGEKIINKKVMKRNN